MSWYSQVVFPCLCDWLLANPRVAALRRQCLASAQGDILEIGFGTGLNLAHYPPSVAALTAIEPSCGMNRRARRRVERSRIAVELLALRGEALPLATASFDTVVSTFTLCSIARVELALAEIRRVLRPGGRFLFLEHGLSPEPHIQRWQRRLDPLQAFLGDGCHLSRDIPALLAPRPFATLTLQQHYLSHVPKTHGYVYWGMASQSPFTP